MSYNSCDFTITDLAPPPRPPIISLNQEVAVRVAVVVLCHTLSDIIEYEIFGEGSHISTNQKRENSAFSPLIG